MAFHLYCGSCVIYKFTTNLEHVCKRQRGACSRCKKSKVRCEKVPDDFLPLVEELFELLAERQKQSNQRYRRIVDEGITEKALRFREQYHKRAKSEDSASSAYTTAEEVATVVKPYMTRSKSRKAAAAKNVIILSDSESPSPEIPSKKSPRNAALERHREVMGKLDGIEKMLSKIYDILEISPISLLEIKKCILTSATVSVDRKDEESELEKSPGKLANWDLV